MAGMLKLGFADLAQNFGSMLAKARRRAFRGHRGAVEDDRAAQTGDRAAFCGIALQFEPHAAMDHLRIGKNLLEIVDRAGGDAASLELRQKLVALEARRHGGQFADELVAMGEPAFVVFVGRGFGELWFAEDAA